MSGKEEIDVKSIKKDVEYSSATDGMPTGELSSIQIKAMRKHQASQLADYKKRLREAVEMKKMQFEELDYNIKYYKAKLEYKELAPKIAELEALEQAEIAEMNERAKAEATTKEKKSEAKTIILPTSGEPRK